MAKEDTVNIGKAKGRPMLTWVGKKPLTSVKAFPAQHVESFKADTDIPLADCDWSDWPEKFDKGGLLFHGDNKDVLAYLLANGFRGKVKLIYIDPPFDSGADYVRKVQLRGVSGNQKIDGEEYTLGEQIQYSDIWANDNYLQFMYERLLLLKELLSHDGSIFLHCDDARNSFLRIILDEVFSSENFRNEIIWKRSTSQGYQTKQCGVLHDSIYWYSKTPDYTFNMQYHMHEKEYLKRARKDENGRLYIPIPTGSPSPRPNLFYEYKGYWPHENGYKWKKEKLEKFDKEGRLIFPKEKSGRIQYKQFLDEVEGVKLQDIWLDIPSVNPVASERSDYPTQKPIALLSRIIKMTTNPGDIVVDSFVGSGTSILASQELGRRWIGSDINKGAIHTTAKRLQQLINGQVDSVEAQEQLIADEDNPSSKPCQSSFSTWRVNDYDLQIQHNEAVELACEYIGITRTRSDSFFEGSRGNKLVKIIPFNHPLTPLDLEAIRTELEKRPEEERDIEIVCLGMELTAQAWLENHNRNRPINKFHLIELRTDNKYGGFIKHEPLSASVALRKAKDKLIVEVTDAYSPSIVKRLNMEDGLFKAQIDDWRAIVDCIMIDTNYDGEVFNIHLTDIPAKKADLVNGKYELPLPSEGSKVAVKIIDMLGEELIITKQVE